MITRLIPVKPIRYIISAVDWSKFRFTDVSIIRTNYLVPTGENVQERILHEQTTYGPNIGSISCKHVTRKNISLLLMEERENEISYPDYKDMLDNRHGLYPISITKSRISFQPEINPFRSLLELDIYQNPFEGLMVLEVPFSTTKELPPLPYFTIGQELTHTPNFLHNTFIRGRVL